MYSSKVQTSSTSRGVQISSDFLLAWQLQIEENKKSSSKVKLAALSYTASQTSTIKRNKLTLEGKIGTYQFRSTSSIIAANPGRDCFFEAVNKSELTRKTLVDKLLANAGNDEARLGFAHEIRQFLYIGYIAGHEDAAENKACKILLNTNIKNLFKNLSDAEASLRDLTEAARSVLGEHITAGLLPADLLRLLQSNGEDLAAEFQEVYSKILEADNLILQFCCDEDLFKNYVRRYFQVACGYIPFTRTLHGEQVDTTIDVINRLFNLNILVFVKDEKKTELPLANKTATGVPIPIYHNGTNHFIGFESTPEISPSSSALPKPTTISPIPPLVLFSFSATQNSSKTTSVASSSSVPKIEEIIEMLPATESPSTYRMSHLLAAGYRGTEYQLLVLLSELTKLIAKGPGHDFEATVENYDSGNLDDVVIVTKENRRLHALKAHQVKYYNHPISIYDFFGEEAQETNKTSGKTEKMHIGKFLDGWLTWLRKYQTLEDKKRKSIIYSNAELDAVLQRCVADGKFKPEFAQNMLIIRVGRNAQIKAFLNKNFLTHLEGQKKAGNYSTKVWNFLQKNGYLDEEGYFANSFNPNTPEFKLDIPAGVLPKDLTSKMVLETLQGLHKAFMDNQIDLYELLYNEAWKYLKAKKLHITETVKTDKERRALFRRFLSSFRFQVNQDDLATLEKGIQDNLVKVEEAATNEVFLCLYYALHEWFRKEYGGKEVPILTRDIITKLIQEALIRSHHLANLQFRSKAVIDRLSYDCEGLTVERPELAALQNALDQPGFVKVVGRKGLGKSGLIKQGLMNREPREYLVFSAVDIVQNHALRTTLLEVLEKVKAIHIVVIDGAEALLQMLPHELQKLLSDLRQSNRTLVLTLTPEESQHSAFQIQGTEITLKPLLQNEVIKKFPQLVRYHSAQSLMRLSEIPFYLSQIIGLISKIGAQEFDFIVKTREKVLEAELVKLAVEGLEAKMVSARRLSWQQLAVTIARSPTVLNQGVTLSPVTPALEQLVKEKIIIKQNEQYHFDHDLFFEHGLMAFWFQKWETAFIEGKTPAYWRKLSQLLTTPGASAILERWLILHLNELMDDLVVNIETLSQTTYLSLVFTVALITKQEQLLDALLSTKKLPLNNVLTGVAGYNSITYILLAIRYDYPLGLEKLLINGASPHHPNAGTLVNNGTSVVYQIPKETTSSSIQAEEQLSNSDEESNSKSDSNHSESDEEEEGNSDYYSHSSDSEQHESVSVLEEEVLEDDEATKLFKDFCSSPYKYWSSGFDEEFETMDEVGELILNPRYQPRPVYDTLYIHQVVIQDRALCLATLLEQYEKQKQLHILNLRSTYDETPLHLGALNGAYASVQLLLKKGASVDVRDYWGETPLHNTAYSQNHSLAKLLLQNGADPNALNDHNLSPLHVALAKLDFSMVELLLKYGADLSLKPFDSNSSDDMIVADLLDEVYRNQEDEVEEFVLNLIRFLNFGHDDNVCKWGTQCKELDINLRKSQLEQVEELMTLVEGRAQISEVFPDFDYCDEETELEYAINNGDHEKIDALQDYILEDPDRIDDVLSSDTFSPIKSELLNTWFETGTQEQYDTLKEYAKLYSDVEALARITEDMSIMEEFELSEKQLATPSNPTRKMKLAARKQ